LIFNLEDYEYLFISRKIIKEIRVVEWN
jgi:hypothetical protein